MPENGSGPLTGLRVVEFASIGPGPHCAMLLADFGADVIRIERPDAVAPKNPVLERGRSVVRLDLKRGDDRGLCLELLERADVLIEGYRPGVMERLGLGPEVVLNRNRGLVYGRMTGWGQDGPLAHAAGHDINYIALTGALSAFGRPGEPATPPLNLVGDYGGGSLYLIFGIMVALWERQSSGQGQIVDASIVDGVTSMMAMFSGSTPSGAISLDRDKSILGGAAPFYRSYLCADGRELAVGAIEPKFFSALTARLGLSDTFSAEQYQISSWKQRSAVLAELFQQRTSLDWEALLRDTDACVTRVLTFDEAPSHPHMKARDAYVRRDGIDHPAPAPRLSRTPGSIVSVKDEADAQSRWLPRSPGS